MTPFLYLTLSLFAQPKEPLRFHESRQIVAQLPADQAAKLPLGRLTAEQGENILVVALLDDATKKPGPAMLGKYERAGNELTFTPRFPLGAGQTYRATRTLNGEKATLDYRIPAAAAKAPPKIVKVYPTADVLPANHLKFYIYFDRPMRGGKELFNHIVLVNDKGKEIADPWLIDEIWDEENNCLILYIHPGRIKWGVEQRLLLGPVLYEKRDYALIIRGAWTDLEGNKIGKDYVKKFRTTAEDRTRIDLSEWKLSTPKDMSREPLTVTFPTSIDHRSLQRFLSVTDHRGNRFGGQIAIGKDEKSWQFTPDKMWDDCTYRLVIDPQLEDAAGNTPDRPFDLDLKAPKLAPQKLRLQFEPQ